MRVLIHFSLLAAIIVLSGCVKPLPKPAPAPPTEARDKDGYTPRERQVNIEGAHWQRSQDLHFLRARRDALRQREGHSAPVLCLSDSIDALDAAR